MTVAQIRALAELTKNLDVTRKVNFTTWRDKIYVTLSFMDNEGEVQRYDIERDGSY